MHRRRGLDGDYDYCRAIAQRHSKTFSLGAYFLPPEKRRAIWAVYAFCRRADDLADRVVPAAQRLAALDAYERRLRAAHDGVAADPVYRAYADAVARFDIPLQPALDLLRGVRMDLVVRRYATYADLHDYCYLVASTVGLLVTPVLGALDERAVGYGIALGRAMQLTNILRDVGEDAQLGRVYLPVEDLERFGYAEAALQAGVVDDAFVALMRFQIARARALYAGAEPGIALLAPESRAGVRLALTLYRRILDAIEANGYDVFTRRAYVPLRTKLVDLALTVGLGIAS